MYESEICMNKKAKKLSWLKFNNPETGKTGSDLGRYMKRHKLSSVDVTVKTGVSSSYVTALIKADHPIKRNMYKRLQGEGNFEGLKGF